MKLSADVKKAIFIHASDVYPEECCGVIVNDQYIACRNVAPTIYDKIGKVKQDKTTNFEIHPEDLANAEDMGSIQAYVHSHPDGTTRATELDLHQIELHKKPWFICSFPDWDITEYQPYGYTAPLLGRNFFHGWQDCYSLVLDFYQRELDITLPNFKRDDAWWENKENVSLYVENYRSAGFYQVESPQYGDVLICRVGRTEHPNHAVIWLGDRWHFKSEDTPACVGNSLILHHMYDAKSIREVYGHEWQSRTVLILRHKDHVKDD
ncbi:MAG: phage tail protein [Flavobacterium johnsoniae]|nr:MAG: phage tail protein [Flavobacterium johnsoniae]